MVAPAVVFLVFSALIFFTPLGKISGGGRYGGLLLWWLKLLCGVALWAVYTFYYTDRANSDIYKYFDDAAVINRAFHENKAIWLQLMTGAESDSTNHYSLEMKNWERNFNKAVPFNENRFMIRLNALLYPISGGNMQVHTLVFCFLSYIGIWLLAAALQHIYRGEKKQVLLALLFPSFLFWTSGGLKESLLLFGFGLLLYGFLKWEKWQHVLLALVGIALLLLLRYFMVICLLPGLVFYRIASKEKTFLQAFRKFVAVNMATILLLMVLAQADRRLNFPRVMAKKQQHAVAEALYTKAGSYSAVPRIDSTFHSVILHMPEGLWSTFSKPYLWQGRNPMMLLSAVENAVLWLLFGYVMYRRPREGSGAVNWPEFFLLLNFVLLYGSLIGLTTPVIGNLVRYRVMLLPFVVLLLGRWRQAVAK